MKWVGWAMFGAALALMHPARAAEAPKNFSVYDAPKLLPEIQFEDGEGHSRKLVDFRGKIVLLNFWATWCWPCRNEMPTLDRLQVELGGPDFQVLALSIDQGGADVVRRFYAEIGIQHLATNLDVASTAVQAFRVVGLPTTVLIDGDGREIGRLIGPADWDTPEMTNFLKTFIAPQKENHS